MPAVTTRVQKQARAPIIDLSLTSWELAVVSVSALVFLLMSYFLLTDFSVRRLLWPTAGDGAYSRPIGRVALALNSTLRQGHSQAEFVPLNQGDPVYPMDTIMAGPGSALKIALNDRSVVELGENSMIRLNFDTALRLSGLDRQMVVEVVTGTVAAKGTEDARLKLRSQDKTYDASGDKALQISRKGNEVDTREGKSFDVVGKVKDKLAAAALAFKSMGGVMTPNKNSAPGTSLADIYSKMKGESDGAGQGGREGAKPMAQKAGGAANQSVQIATKLEVAMKSKVAEEMLGSTGRFSSRAKIEIAKAVGILPEDNFVVKAEGSVRKLEFPVAISWKAEPENAPFKVRFSRPGDKDVVIPVKADDGDVKLNYVFRKPGDYTWKIEDYGGAVLSIRSIHVNSKFQAIELSDPILIGRERGSNMWTAQHLWAFQFKWKPIKGVKDYKIRITRNLKDEDGVVAEKVVQSTEFVLPFKKEWQAERMFFSVEGAHPLGFRLASRNVPFMFTFLPPKPRVPLNRKEIARSNLVEGALMLDWEANSDAGNFTIEIATDPAFQHKVANEATSENLYRFYPDGEGKFYWHVRGDKDNLSSPFSETWEFTIK